MDENEGRLGIQTVGIDVDEIRMIVLQIVRSLPARGLAITCAGFILLVYRVSVFRLQCLKITQGGKDVAVFVCMEAMHSPPNQLSTPKTLKTTQFHASLADHPSIDRQAPAVSDHDRHRARRVGITRVHDPPQASTQHRTINPSELLSAEYSVV
jgi:hypothetical protein